MTLFVASIAIGLLAWFMFPNKQSALYQFQEVSSFSQAIGFYLIPALFFLVWALFHSTDASRFRLSLLGLGFRADTERNITVGSDYRNHDIWVANLHSIPKSTDMGQTDEEVVQPAEAGTLKFTAGANGRPGSLVLLKPNVQSATGNYVGLLMTNVDRNYRSPLSVPLQTGDKLQFEDSKWQLAVDMGWSLCPPHSYLENINNPAEHLTLRLKSTCNADATKRTYVLNDAFNLPPPIIGLIYRGKQEESMMLAALDPNLQLLRNGQPIATSVPALNLSNGTRLHVLALPLSPDEDAFNWSGLRDKRSFRIQIGQRNVLLQFDTPEVYTLAWQDLKGLNIHQTKQNTDTLDATDTTDRKKSAPLRIGLSTGSDWLISDQSLYLKNVSRKVGAESFAIVELPASWRETNTAFSNWPVTEPITVSFPGGRTQVTNGQPFWLGENNLTALQIDLLTIPWGLVWLTLLFAFVKATIATLTRASAAHLTVAAMIELLVVLRIILGYRVWVMPPAHPEAMRLALIAWSILPWNFSILSLPAFAPLASKLPNVATRKDRKWGWGLASLGFVFSAVWCYQIGGLIWVGLHAVIAIFIVLIAQWTLINGYIKNQVTLLTNWRKHWDPWSWLALPALFIVVRVTLASIGIKERILIGGFGLSLSLIHIPLAILFQTYYLVWLWRRFENNLLHKWDWLVFSGVVLLIWLGPSAIASDWGTLLNGLIVCVFGFILLKEYNATNANLLVAFVVAILISMLIFVNMDYIPETWQYNRNILRLVQGFKPTQVSEIGIKASEELTVMYSVIQAYIENNLWGYGYMQSELSPHIPASGAMSDYVTAVFVAGEWGRIGVWGLFFIYAIGMVVGSSMFTQHNHTKKISGTYRAAELDRSRMLAGLALITFCLPSLYMIIANHNLLVFTGKNVYLLGLNSGSDIVEALILLLFFARGVTMIRDRVAGYVQ